jgi:hypothetical protein
MTKFNNKTFELSSGNGPLPGCLPGALPDGGDPVLDPLLDLVLEGRHVLGVRHRGRVVIDT